jgi:PAS domain S-box-containing protein
MKRSEKIRIRVAKGSKLNPMGEAAILQRKPTPTVDVDWDGRIHEREITIEFLRLVNESTGTRGLIQSATTFFQQQAGCQAVGIRLKDGNDYPYFEARGFPKKFLVTENSLCLRDEGGRILRDDNGKPLIDSLCGKVICGKVDAAEPCFTAHGSYWTNSTTEVLAASRKTGRQICVRNRCHRDGYESVALIPLKVGEERLGLLQLNDCRTGIFSPATIGLWERLADQLAVALAKFRAEEELFESRANLSRAQLVAQTGSWWLNLQHDELRWSEETNRIFGIPKDTPVTYEIFLDCVHPDDREYLMQKWQAALRGSPYDIEHRIIVDGNVRWVHEKSELEFDAQGVPTGGFGTVQDITDSKKKENELQRLNRMLKALRDSSQALSCASRESDFLDAVCRIIVEDCGHQMVWIGFAEEDERKSVRPAAFAGFGKDYLETLNITWADNDRGHGPTGTAIRRGRPTACRNMLSDPRFKPWREEAVKRGYASSLAVPLMEGNKAFGALTIYSREPDPFSNEEVRLISELANDLAFGIMSIRLRIAHEQAEELLCKSEERYRSLVELSPDAVLVNRDDRIEYVNPAGLQLFGAETADQLLGKVALELFHPDYWDIIRTRIKQAREGQYPPTLEEKIVRLNGETRSVEVAASPFTDQQGKAIQVVLHDITQRKKAEEQLRLHLTILESTANAIVIASRNGTIQWVNSAFTQLTGYTSAEVIGMNPRVFKSGLQEPKFYRHIWKTILAGKVWQGELVNKRKDGSLYTEEMTITPVADSRNSIRHFIAVKQDVTERKLMEDRLRFAKEAAEAANVAKDQFLANISHELRTPMNAILGMTELALGEDLPPSIRDYLTTAKESADMLLELLNEILDFSRIEAAEFQLEPANFSLRKMLAHTLKSLGVQAYDKRLELICDLTEQVPDQLFGDSLRIRQVLTNLIGNAVKFTSRGKIVVNVVEQRAEKLRVFDKQQGNSDDSSIDSERLSKVGRESQSKTNGGQDDDLLLKFSVEDTGIGIAPSEQERIFAPFMQADISMTRNYGGTGLGLAIASSLVKLMGGQIWVESQPGRGSIFSFTALLKRVHVTTKKSKANFTPSTQLQGLPILVVAENPALQCILQTMLLRWGMKPDVMGDVPAALVKLHETTAAGQVFSVALIDASLSKIDGYTLASWIKNHPGLVGSTILMFSPCDRVAHVRRCQELGIPYLEKPIFQPTLLSMVSQAIGLTDCSPPVPSSSSSRKLPKASQSKRILVVEDNLANQQLALHILRKSGHLPCVAANGWEAVERVRKEEFDLVLMDVQMPLMDGYQATAAIRAMTTPAKSQLPIIAMTAHAMKEDEQRCLQAGMDGYLNKPINAVKLLEIIEDSAKKQRGIFSTDLKPKPRSSAAVSDAIFNQEVAFARCFDREMFNQMRDFFFDQSAEVLKKIQDALSRGAAEEIARAAHALRGTVVYLGSDPCMEAIERVENLGRSGNLDSMAEAIQPLSNQIDRLKQALTASMAKTN